MEGGEEIVNFLLKEFFDLFKVKSLESDVDLDEFIHLQVMKEENSRIRCIHWRWKFWRLENACISLKPLDLMGCLPYSYRNTRVLWEKI